MHICLSSVSISNLKYGMWVQIKFFFLISQKQMNSDTKSFFKQPRKDHFFSSTFKPKKINIPTDKFIQIKIIYVITEDTCWTEIISRKTLPVSSLLLYLGRPFLKNKNKLTGYNWFLICRLILPRKDFFLLNQIGFLTASNRTWLWISGQKKKKWN